MLGQGEASQSGEGPQKEAQHGAFLLLTYILGSVVSRVPSKNSTSESTCRPPCAVPDENGLGLGTPQFPQGAGRTLLA